MGWIRLKKTWFTGLVLLSFVLFLLSPLYYNHNTESNHGTIPNYRIYDGLNSRGAILKEPHSDYLAFLLKSVRFVSLGAKYLYSADGAKTNLKFLDTRNLAAALGVIILFIMFYQLSRTTFEKPDSHKRQVNCLQ
ncbi:MAG TPA: hypothetical protein VHY08_24835 [Bacillota bacterium]|nr:hypothetical protein [Bacillota bacterium]